MLNLLRGAWDLFSGKEHSDEPWATDEEAFSNHFGVDYDDYADMVDGLDRAHSQLYEDTMKINPEAAVTWVVFISDK